GTEASLGEHRAGRGRANDEDGRRRHPTSFTRVAYALSHLVTGERLPDRVREPRDEDHRERVEREDLARDGVDPRAVREEDDLAVHRGQIERVAGLGRTRDDDGRGRCASGGRLPIYEEHVLARTPRGRRRPRDPDGRAIGVEPQPFQWIGLQVRTAVAAGLESKAAKLTRDVCGHGVELRARRRPAEHGIVGDDVDPASHVGGRDGGHTGWRGGLPPRHGGGRCGGPHARPRAAAAAPRRTPGEPRGGEPSVNASLWPLEQNWDRKLTRPTVRDYGRARFLTSSASGLASLQLRLAARLVLRRVATRLGSWLVPWRCLLAAWLGPWLVPRWRLLAARLGAWSLIRRRAALRLRWPGRLIPTLRFLWPSGLILSIGALPTIFTVAIARVV